jgi:NAD-dependent DNA ligase
MSRGTEKTERACPERSEGTERCSIPEIASQDSPFRARPGAEVAYPELQSPDSPTQRVGANAGTSLAKHTHKRS